MRIDLTEAIDGMPSISINLNEDSVGLEGSSPKRTVQVRRLLNFQNGTLIPGKEDHEAVRIGEW